MSRAALRVLAGIGVACSAAVAIACGGAARQPDVAQQRAFERDHERCLLQAQNVSGVVHPGDYQACMRARGWNEPPPDPGSS